MFEILNSIYNIIIIIRNLKIQFYQIYSYYNFKEMLYFFNYKTSKNYFTKKKRNYAVGF